MQVFYRGLSTEVNAVKRNAVIRLRGTLFRVSASQHVTQGRQGAHYNLDLKHLTLGSGKRTER